MAKRDAERREYKRTMQAEYRRRDRAAVSSVRQVLACGEDSCDPCGACLLALRDVLGIGEDAVRDAISRLEKLHRGRAA